MAKSEGKRERILDVMTIWSENVDIEQLQKIGEGDMRKRYSK